VCAVGNTATKKLEKWLKCDAHLDIEQLQQKRKMLTLPEKLWPPGTSTPSAFVPRMPSVADASTRMTGVVYHMYMLPRKTWSDKARERQRKQEQDNEDKNPEEVIMGTRTLFLLGRRVRW
jgi:hypothetical protein